MRRFARMGWLGLALILLFAGETRAAEPRRVLLLHAFGHPYSPWSDFAASFRAELVKTSPWPIDLYEVSLDTARVQNPRDEGPFVDYIVALLAGRKLDLIVPVGAPAASFMQRHRPQLFPDVPMLVIGAAKRFVSSDTMSTNDTAVLLDLPLPNYIENILGLMPDTKTIGVVVGDSAIERSYVSVLKQEFQTFADRVHFEWFNKLTFSEMLKRGAAMPQQSAILWFLLSEDAAGVPYSQDRSLETMREVANVPIFGIGDYELGRGIVGGRLMPTQTMGRNGAEIGLRILQGEAPGR